MTAVLFDLGNTLAAYYRSDEFEPILARAVRSVRRELARLGLAERVDTVVLCTEVGWRKPHRQIFQHAARALGATCAECVFVGDDPVWDGEGAASVGMRPVLLDREDRHADYRGERVASLRELPALLD